MSQNHEAQARLIAGDATGYINELRICGCSSCRQEFRSITGYSMDDALGDGYFGAGGDEYYAEPTPAPVDPQPARFFEPRRRDQFYWLRDRLQIPEGESSPEFCYIQPGHERYSVVLRYAFNFVRRHSGGRYTDSTTMKLLRAAEEAEDNLGSEHQPAHLPRLAIAEAPFSYDEETEVKTGGIVAMAATFPQENGKTVMVVHREKRRRGLGRALHSILQMYHNELAYWVGQRNFDGQKFLLSLEYAPTAIDSRGSIRFTSGYEDEQV